MIQPSKHLSRPYAVVIGITCFSIVALTGISMADPSATPATPADKPITMPQTLPSQIPELTTELKNAKELRFDATLKVSDSPDPIEVAGTISSASDINVVIRKFGKEVCLIQANENGGASFVPSINQYYKFEGPPNADFPAGLQAGPFVHQKVGANSELALTLSIIALRHMELLEKSGDQSSNLKWVRTETNSNGETLEIESANDSFSGSDSSQQTISVAIKYTNSPWSLRAIDYKTVKVGASRSFSLTFSKCDLISDPAQLTEPKQFVFAPPVGSTEFIPPSTSSDPTQQPQSTALQAGAIAPSFSVVSANGSKVRLSDYKGKVVVVDLWATWCGPCQMSLPHTDKIAHHFQTKGVVFLPVCVWDDKASFAKWLGDHKGMSMHFLFDNAPSQDVSFSTKLYKVDGIPTQFVIGRNGRIASTFSGYDSDGDPDETALTKAIDKALAQ